MGLLNAGTSVLRTAALAFVWPLSIVALILSCLVAANGHWKPRAASIFTAIVAALTIVTLPFLFIGRALRLTRIGGARCSRMWELVLTGLWLASWVWIATQLNKFHCTNPNNFTTTTTTGSSVGFSLYGHALTPQGAPHAALAAANGMEKLLDSGSPRGLGFNGRRRYAKRCRVFKALLGFAIPIFAILALDLIAHLWRVTPVDAALIGAGAGAAAGAAGGAAAGRHSLSPSISSVSSVSSVGSPRIAGGETVPVTETKV
ncbi:hypothetical protein GGI04_005893 [Coemansia thaxteri]|uniref:MARVEL domain-containing protein n=1 Tax=Coemansia thaxteri TaxID=2663907 RepID=A0A9W8BN21_9FUNG|nr:hypothetical protein GGI04_005893 [Coemansia thaxteri]KAJ2008372.1 hypothetical protein H4R26_000228 [Coemansia thaxteri]KAJ2460321.1 hypothetical protein GGI02_005774 [Coemansia sp. RSA 2322]KAJ2487614.1 hypothetical protein EV174_000442 [Coemansia sp. RSA 2320]